ncbi:MAG: Nramp family divalent metal transporter [Phycisphaerae bacterium]|nr:Nramp family divalent metal transporter [Phycisphaerae bacterium]
MKKLFSWLTRIGPGFVVCAVVLGPGSLTAATRMGAKFGYAMLWIPLMAGVAMAYFTTVFMRYGIESNQSFLTQVRRSWGRWYAGLCGFAMFFVCASFQFGNNVGVATGMDGMLARSVQPGEPIQSVLPPWAWIVGFNALSILFLFAFKKVYSIIEKGMTALVAIMVIVFFANLYFARPSPSGFLKGCVPTIPADMDWFLAAATVATTFSIVAAIFQGYFVRARGWQQSDYQKGVADSISGIAILTLVTMVVLATSAKVLQGQQVQTAADMANQLQRLFGTFSRVIFCIGFVSAAFSSFLVNAMIGGTLLSDGFGFGDNLNGTPAKVFSTLALLVGMGIALAVKYAHVSFADALMLGEAGTLLTIPVVIPATMLVLFARKRSTFQPVGWVGRVATVAGLCLLIFMAVMSFEKILQRVHKTFGG